MKWFLYLQGLAGSVAARCTCSLR